MIMIIDETRGMGRLGQSAIGSPALGEGEKNYQVHTGKMLKLFY